MSGSGPTARRRDTSASLGPTSCPAGNGLFTLYYGYIQNPASSDSTLQEIAGTHPNFVIVGQGLEGRSDIPTYLHQNSVQAIQYIPMGYGTSATITATIDTAMQAGYDGVFFDQVSTDSSFYAWNSAQAAHVKSYGVSKLVIANPGLVPPDASMFDYADIVSVENAYTQTLPASWGLPAWRWLAVQGDPASLAATSDQDAENRLAAFRANGGFWYYSSAYAASGATAIDLPSWYQSFAGWVAGQAAPSCPTATPTATDTPTDTPTNTPSDTPTSTATSTPTTTDTSTPSGAPAYSAIDLGTLPGGQSTYASTYSGGINAAGQVVGFAYTVSLAYHAYLYNGTLSDLGTLGGTDSSAAAVNTNGEIVGTADVASGARHAYLYNNGAMTDLGTLPGGLSSSATGINASGQVAGYSGTTGADHAFLYSGGVMTDLGTLPGGLSSDAYAINDTGQIVGQAMTASFASHAFLYSGGVMTDLGTFGGRQSGANAINNSGQIAGYADTASGAEHAFLDSGGVMADLGTLPGGSYTIATGINASGQVVGNGDIAGGAGHAFLYTNGAMIDLNSLLPPTFGVVLGSAWCIDDAGQIVAEGSVNGSVHTFLLTPGSAATATASATVTPSATGTATSTPTDTPTATDTSTPSPTNSPTGTPTATATNMATSIPSATSTPLSVLLVNPRGGADLQPITLTGMGYAANEPVALSWDVTTTAPLTATTTSNGSFTVTSTVPQAPYGAHTLSAVGQMSMRSAHATFSVQSRTTLLLAKGTPGARRALDGTGFAAHEMVRAYWQNGLLLGSTTTDASGSFAGATGITWTVPLSPTGGYRVYTVGLRSRAVTYSTFAVQPSLSVSPPGGAPGSTAVISGSGYAAGESVQVLWNCGSSACRGSALLGTATTNANGSFSGLGVTIPTTATLGAHAFGGKGMTSRAFAVAYATTGAPLVDVTAYGAVGDGVSDDTAAFARAQAALRAAGHGILVVPAGTYQLNPDTLSLSSNMAIVGDNATLRSNALGFEMLAISGTNVTVQGITIDGARQADGTALATRGISIYQGSSYVTIRDTTVQGIGQAPVGTTGANANLVTATPTGIMVYGNVNVVTIDGATIGDVRAVNKDPGYDSWVARGILITAGNDANGAPLPNVATNVTIENSSFQGIGPKDDGDAIVMQPSDNTANPNQNAHLLVLNNTFNDIAKRAVKLQVGGATIAGNVITNDFNGNNLFLANPGNPDRYGSDPNATEHYDAYAAISTYKSNVVIVGNTIAPLYGSFYRAIEVAGDPYTSTGTQNVLVSRNVVSMGSATDPNSGLSQNLISLDTASGPVSGVTISTNTLVTAPYGISLSAAAQAAGPVITGNTFVNVHTPLTVDG